MAGYMVQAAELRISVGTFDEDIEVARRQEPSRVREPRELEGATLDHGDHPGGGT